MKKTLARKLNPKGIRRRLVKEVKANITTFAVKEYFFRQLTGVRFGLYALTLNKDRLYPELQRQKDRTYNYLARLILDQLPLENASDAVNLVLDKRKNRKERQKFNAYIKKELASRPDDSVGFGFHHRGPSMVMLWRIVVYNKGQVFQDEGSALYGIHSAAPLAGEGKFSKITKVREKQGRDGAF